MHDSTLDFHSWNRKDNSSSVKLCQQAYDVFDSDPAEAAALLRRSAGTGYAEAQFMLGHCYAQGIGVEADDAQAKKWYALARAKNFPVDFYLRLFAGTETKALQALPRI